MLKATRKARFESLVNLKDVKPSDFLRGKNGSLRVLLI